MSSKKCYGYVAIKSPRTSTKTLESMSKTIKKYADSHEMQLDKLYFDILYGDGAGRHNMKRMQEDARENGVSIIIVGDLKNRVDGGHGAVSFRLPRNGEALVADGDGSAAGDILRHRDGVAVPGCLNGLMDGLVGGALRTIPTLIVSRLCVHVDGAPAFLSAGGRRHGQEGAEHQGRQ